MMHPIFKVLAGISFSAIAAASEPSIQEKLDRLFVIRSPQVINGKSTTCSLQEKSWGAVYFSSPEIAGRFQRGAEFSLLALSGKRVSGRLERVLLASEECAFLSADEPISLGLVNFDEPVSFGADADGSDVRIAIQGARISDEDVGSIEVDRSMIPKKHNNLPKDLVENGRCRGDCYSIITPKSKKSFVFVSSRFSDPKEYETLGDKAFRLKTECWDLSGATPIKLFEIAKEVRIFSVLEFKKGEVLLGYYEGELYGGTYSLVRFDGRNAPQKVVRSFYSWSD